MSRTNRYDSSYRLYHNGNHQGVGDEIDRLTLLCGAG